MGRRDAELSKIVGSTDDSLAEMMLPETIHHDPRRQWVVSACNPTGELEAAASLGDRLLIVSRQQAREMARDDIAELVIAPANLDFRVLRALVGALRRAAFLKRVRGRN